MSLSIFLPLTLCYICRSKGIQLIPLIFLSRFVANMKELVENNLRIMKQRNRFLLTLKTNGTPIFYLLRSVAMISLFNGILTFLGYLMPKSSLTSRAQSAEAVEYTDSVFAEE